jgi:hypothetical protein
VVDVRDVVDVSGVVDVRDVVDVSGVWRHPRQALLFAVRQCALLDVVM